MENNKSLLTGNFVLVTLSSFLYFFNFHGYILLPVRINSLGGTESDIGFIMGAASLSTIISTPVSGYLADRYLRKKVMFTGALLLIMSGLCLLMLNKLNFYYSLIRFIQGISFSLFFVAAGTLITDISPQTRRTQALGIFGVFTIINYALAPYLGRLFTEAYGFDAFYIFISSFGILSIIFLLPVKESGIHTSQNSDNSLKEYKSLLNYKILVPAITLFFVGSGFIPTLTFLPVFSLSIGIKEYEKFFIGYTASVLIIRIFAGWVPDKFGKLITLYPSLIVFCSGIIYLGYSFSETDLIVCSILFGAGHGFIYPTLYALVIDSGNPANKGKLFSISSVSFTFGGMAGSFIYGIVASNYNYFVMFRLMGIVCAMSVILFLYYKYKKMQTC